MPAVALPRIAAERSWPSGPDVLCPALRLTAGCRHLLVRARIHSLGHACQHRMEAQQRVMANRDQFEELTCRAGPVAILLVPTGNTEPHAGL